MCSVNTSHRVTAFPSRSLSVRLFLWNLESEIWKPIEGYDEKGNFFR
ncbi:nef attachable domain protein [Chlamydia psittaci 02DC14]|nr:nef attachable domain protein [Chlamydia psittaci 02DC21]EPL02447.1 nef attachable domain protein [Chlamydia psittaci 02DC14]EPL02468.1 putative nef attachable protein [Chlamydia psittaci 09DC79]